MTVPLEIGDSEPCTFEAHRATHLDWLEHESIHILRELAAECAKPALLFSGGKDSAVVLHLALKAFSLGPRRTVRLPFPLVHVDTGSSRRPTPCSPESPRSNV